MNFQAFETYFKGLDKEIRNTQGWLDQILDGEGLTDREFGSYEKDLINLYTQGQPLWVRSQNSEVRQWLELCAPKHFRWISDTLYGMSQTLVHASTREPHVPTLRGLRTTLEDLVMHLKSLWGSDEAPAAVSFQFEGFKVLNPDRLSDWAVKQLLDTIEYTKALFKKRGMEDLLMDGVNSVELLLAYPANAAAAGLYRSGQKQIVLIANNILNFQGTRHGSYRWVDEVFVHEFGHYVHMTYITGEARKFWDGTWAPVEEAAELDKQDHVKMWGLTRKERDRFWKLLEKARFDPSVVRGKLKSPDREKFVAWMYAAGFLKCNADCSRTSLLPRGVRFRDFFRDPAAWRAKYMSDRGLENNPRDLAQVDTIRKQYAQGYAESLELEPGQTGVSRLWSGDPKLKALFGPMGDPGTAQMEKARAKVTEEWGTPSEYGKTNVLEDFAESFVQFIVSPQKMTEKGLYRMKRTIWISGFGNKPVMRLAVKLARRWLRAAGHPPGWVMRSTRSGRNVEGPNGSKAVAYEWRSTLEDAYSRSEEGLVTKRVSDWSNPEVCASCGRQIVHVYWVRDPEGNMRAYGGDHLHIALGYPREISTSRLRKIQDSITTAAEVKRVETGQKERYEAILKSRRAPSKRDANMLYSAILRKSHRTEPLPVVWLTNQEGEFLRGDDLILRDFFRYTQGWWVQTPAERVASTWLKATAVVRASSIEAPPAMLRDITKWVLSLMASEALRWVEKIREKEKDPKRWKNTVDFLGEEGAWGSVVDLAETERLAKKYGGRLPTGPRPKEHTRKFPLDLTGWKQERYVQDIIKSSGKDPLWMLDPTIVTWVTDPKDAPPRVRRSDGSVPRGTWDTGLLRIFWSPPSVGSSKYLKRHMDDVARLIRHELQHLSQSVLQMASGVDTAGLPAGGTHEHVEEHALRDVEFYTRIQDEIDNFRWDRGLLGPNNRQVTIKAVKVWIGEAPAQAVGLLSLQPSWFFQNLKSHAPQKYRKAVKEFWKAILAEENH